MPEFIRAYLFIIIIAAIGFFLLKKITRDHISLAQFKSWRNGWFFINTVAFLGINYWIFAILTFSYVAIKRLKEVNPIAFYVAILFAVPPIHQNIPGFGLMNYLFQITYLRLLSMAIIIPLFIKLITSNKSLKFGSVKTDIFVLLYVCIMIGLQFRDTTFTDAIRQSLIIFIDWFAPYYVISRYVKTVEHIKLIFFAFLFASIPVALIGIFESIKHWLLYSTMESALGISWGYGGYLGRSGSLRASSSFGHPIVFGYCMAVALGIYLYLKDHILIKAHKRIALGIILLGLIAPMSRGPWVGALAVYLTYMLFSKNGVQNIVKFSFVSIFAFSIATQLPSGEKLINLIPFVGKTEQFNVDYRQKLIDVSFLVVAKHPFFGKVNFREEPEMKQMVQGQGIIDIVNSYVSVMLSSGYIGLFSFLGIFISTLILTLNTMRKVKNYSFDLYNIGKSLLASLIGIMTIIMTVGEILAVPYVFILIIGISVAYTNLANKNLSTLKKEVQ
jgi:hypothetical protein